GRVLALAVAPPAGARVLDVGAGTGAVARALREFVGPDALVVVADASATMLYAAGRTGLHDAVVAMLPELPFSGACFDAVTSAFVMTHVDDADAAALEMRRVLRPGGSIGLSAWYPADDDAAREWSRMIRTFVDAARVEAAVRATLPGDARFAAAGSLAALLQDAGFVSINASDHTVECAMSVGEYVESRSVCATGRALRAMLAPADWDRLRESMLISLGQRFPDGVRFARAFHTVTGVKPR
ncbi:MAG TPA: methyltransferase domain-containing protein, partial [Candidatus Krumholzibacteria bacterium]|nr:methyltransferase domain-containing protein [Candidatus Krumholzibacteria bacterium]